MKPIDDILLDKRVVELQRIITELELHEDVPEMQSMAKKLKVQLVALVNRELKKVA